MRATIDGPPTNDADGHDAWYVPSNSTVLAGKLPAGPVMRINEDEGRLVDFPPGDYLFLLERIRSPGDYFVLDGIRGAFRVSGDTAAELCATSPPGTPVPTPGTISNIDDIIALFGPLLSGQGSP